MNRSAAEVEDVPPRVVTVMATVPEPVGLTTVISVGETTSTLVAGVDPKSTLTGELKFVPVIVTVVAPASDPVDGLTEVTKGADSVVVR